MTEALRHAKKELRAAESAIRRMLAARAFDDFEFAWNDYLARIEKVWEKVEQACKGQSSKFQPWQGKYARLRRKDPLLRYIHQARNADHHTLSDSVEFQPGRYSFTVGKPGQDVYIKSLRTDHTGRVSYYEGNVAPEIIDEPPKLVLLRVKNFGATFNPPTQHLGQQLVSADPLSVAHLGLTFYRQLVEEAESSFFPPGAFKPNERQ